MINVNSHIETGLVLAMLVGTTLSLAQDNVSSREAPSPVYVVDFESVAREFPPSEASSRSVDARDIAQLTTSLIRLGLLATPTLEVKATDRDHVCGGRAGQAEGNSKASSQDKAPAQYQSRREPIIESKGTKFFKISGLVEVDPPNTIVHYWLKACDGSTLTDLNSDSLTLPADRSSFAAENALGNILGQINTIPRFLAYTLENPPVTVAVEQFQLHGQKIAVDLAGNLKWAITRLPSFKLAEISEKPDYIIGGSVTARGNEIDASIQIRSASGGPPHSFKVSGVAKLRRVFDREVATGTVRALDDMRLAERYGWDALSATSFEKLLEEGRDRLCCRNLWCEDQPRSCRKDLSAAVRVFEVAKKNPKADWRASYYLAVAQAANYKYPDAIKSFSDALLHIESSALNGPEAKEAKIKVHNAQGNVYEKYGDTKNAVLRYEESLKLDPEQPEVYVKKAEAVFSNDRPGGIHVLLDGIPRMHDAQGVDKLHSALLKNLRKLQEGDFKAVEAQFERASAAGAPINNEYALLWVLWGETGPVNADAVRQKQYVTNALALHATDAEVQAEAYALRAAIDLPGNLDVADKFLTLAEELPTEKLEVNTLGWLARLRGIYFLDRKNYAAASEWADKAHTIDASSESDLLSAQVANSWAKSLRDVNPKDERATRLFTQARDLTRPLVGNRYEGADSAFHTANHGLGLDQDSEKLFKTIVDKKPKDFSAILSLAFVCNEYLFDTACSYSQTKRLLSLDLSALSPSDRAAMKVNAAEAAVLQGEYQHASAWLDDALPDLSGDDYRAIVDFYKFWIALASSQAVARYDFDHLRQSLTAYAESQRKPDAQPSGWSFQGARHALAQSALSPQKQKLLSDVITVLEDPTKNEAALQLPSKM
jgi:tetratricopeptide (TPR) repeat protein